MLFGVTGDLARKKLMPAIYDLANRGLLPPGFSLVGFARRDWADQDFAQGRPRLGQGARAHPVPRGGLAPARRGLPLRAGRRSTTTSAFDLLAETVEDLDEQRGTGGNHAFYLSIPPRFFADVVGQLQEHGLTEDSRRRLAPGRHREAVRLTT